MTRSHGAMCVTCAMHLHRRARAGTWALHAHRSAHGARTGTLRPLRVHCMCIHGICISQGNDRRIGICICSRMHCSFRKMSSHVESNQRVPMLTRLPGMLWIYVDIAVCRVSSGISETRGVARQCGSILISGRPVMNAMKIYAEGISSTAALLSYLIVSLTWPETNLLTCKTKSVFNFGIRKLQDVCDFDVCTKCSRLTSFVDDLAYQGQHWYLCLYYLHGRTLEC